MDIQNSLVSTSIDKGDLQPIAGTAKKDTTASPNTVVPNQDTSKQDNVNIKSSTQTGKAFPNLSIIDSSAPVDNKAMDKKANGYVSEINKLWKQNENLAVEDKEKIIGILSKSKDDGSLNSVAKKLDKNGDLPKLYRDMGSIVNQGNAGAVVSGFLTIFTLGISTVAEAKSNKAFKMRDIFEEGNVDRALIDKLDK